MGLCLKLRTEVGKARSIWRMREYAKFKARVRRGLSVVECKTGDSKSRGIGRGFAMLATCGKRRQDILRYAQVDMNILVSCRITARACGNSKIRAQMQRKLLFYPPSWTYVMFPPGPGFAPSAGIHLSFGQAVENVHAWRMKSKAKGSDVSNPSGCLILWQTIL